MEKLAAGIIKHKRLVVVLFALTLAVSIFFIPKVVINYDLSSYLPSDVDSTRSLKMMESEFAEALPNVDLMIPNVSVAEALKLKADLEQMEFVSQVLWLDDTLDIEIPLEMQDRASVESFYKDNNALMMLTTNDSLATTKQLKILQDFVGEKGAVRGELVDLADAQVAANDEIVRIVAFIIPISLLILAFATHSWFEPLLFLFTILVSVALNMGTNIVFSSISFITLSVGAVLQMAVSMDYAVFLLRRFSAFRAEGDTVEIAMKKAIVAAFSSITASALTTFFGFLALIFMRFRIGPDLGIVLAKGIVFSLIGALILLPVLVIYTYKIIEKTSHKEFMPKFNGLGKITIKLRWLFLILALVLTLPMFLAQKKNDFLYGMGAYAEGSREARDAKLIADEFGRSMRLVMLVPTGHTELEQALVNAVHKVDKITSITGYTTAVGAKVPLNMLSQSQKERLASDKHSRYIIVARVDEAAPENFALAGELRDLADKYFNSKADSSVKLGTSTQTASTANVGKTTNTAKATQAGELEATKRIAFVGEAFSLTDMRDTIRDDNIIVNGLAILAVALIIMLTFRSLILPILLVFTIELSIWINFAIPYFMGTNLNFIGYLVISTVQLGATVDYAILMTDRYIYNRRFYLPKEAARRTIAEEAGSIIPPALILTAAGVMLGVISSISIVSELGTVLGRGGILSLFMVLFLLPNLLVSFDKIIEKTSWKMNFRQKESQRVAVYRDDIYREENYKEEVYKDKELDGKSETGGSNYVEY